MSWMNAIGGLLTQYAGSNADTANAETHFDQVANAAPPATIGGGLADMFRSGNTPPFAELVAQMFGNANGTQKASVLNELLSKTGGNLPSVLASAGLGGLASTVANGGTITPEAASQVPPEAVQQVAQHMEQHDPSIVDRLSSVYAQHPTLIKTLGSGLLAVTLAKIANRSQS